VKIINATAPCRINDIGGWTDTRFAKYGAVCSIAVNPGVHVQITEPALGPAGISVHLHNYGETWDADDKGFAEKHPFISEAINRTAFEGDDIRIDIYSGMPPGASTGTSAAVVVALLAALAEKMGNPYTTSHLMTDAHRIETELGYESGIQDQAAAAYGGVSFYDIDYPSCKYRPIVLRDSIKAELENRLMLVYLGKPHASSEIHKRVIEKLGENAEDNQHIETLRTLAHTARTALYHGDFETYGHCMTQNTLEQALMDADLVSPIDNEVLDIATKELAIGRKVNGAGGYGGSVTLLTDGLISSRIRLERELVDNGFEIVPVSIARHGAQVWTT
jgi:D-glycero-alpha-D-manno-heptose-7-phosphate kinase